MSMLRNQKDLRTLMILLLATILSGYMLILRLSDLSLFSFLFWLLFSSLVVFIVSVINHNHRHCSIFSHPLFNRIVDYGITFCIGAPSTRLHQVHVLNHHRYYQSEMDWTCYKTTAFGNGVLRVYNYIRNASALIRQNRKSLDSLDLKLKKQITDERVFLYLIFACACILNLKTFLLLWLPSRILGLLLLFISNLMNHDGCELDSKYDHSRDFVSPFENWIFFNSGYHTIHHASAASHWADLPTLHALRIAPNKSPKFIERSFWIYSLKVLWPMPRISSNSIPNPLEKRHRQF